MKLSTRMNDIAGCVDALVVDTESGDEQVFPVAYHRDGDIEVYFKACSLAEEYHYAFRSADISSKEYMYLHAAVQQLLAMFGFYLLRSEVFDDTTEGDMNVRSVFTRD